ncbi:hypothetical protein KSP40_PGU010670 [Platanthera guangdongensis]|uniref:BCNT-C domain-containing protein n=1 Tax=Platanthera guangdongensis TaxID=2320717 RepID=A0ABR2MX10_9ASPA
MAVQMDMPKKLNLSLARRWIMKKMVTYNLFLQQFLSGLNLSERKARVNAAWAEMNRGLSVKVTNTSMSRSTPKRKTTIQKTPGWMTALGLAPKPASANQETLGKRPAAVHNCTSEGARKAAAEALSAVREIASATAIAGKLEVGIKEVRDFAGHEIEVRKLVDANSREAVDKAKAGGSGQASALDIVLDQIKKKPKLSVLDKSKMDWGEFKEEHKGMEDELDAYKKSSNQYLDKVSFLQRTDLREFERERDARLAMARRRNSDIN